MEFKRITRTDDPLYARAIALYHDSFPLHEQREALSQSRILENDAYHFNVICDNGAFVGEILYWAIGDFFYIEHFCIDLAVRNKGYGQKTLSALQNTPLVLEIDPPIDAISLRRKHFYERCGFVENPYPHVQLPYHRGGAEHRLVIMSRPRTLSRSEYEGINEYLHNTVMKDVY